MFVLHVFFENLHISHVFLNVLYVSISVNCFVLMSMQMPAMQWDFNIPSCFTYWR